MLGSQTIICLCISCAAAFALVACTDPLQDGAGGAATSSGVTSNATSTGTTTSTSSGTNPCVLDSSKLDECTLQ